MLEQVDTKVEPQCMELLMLVLVLRLVLGLGLGLGLALKVEEQNVYLLHRYFYPFCSSVRHNKDNQAHASAKKAKGIINQYLTIAETSTCIMSFTSPADLQTSRFQKVHKTSAVKVCETGVPHVACLKWP
jgi:hypothetical protein